MASLYQCPCSFCQQHWAAGQLRLLSGSHRVPQDVRRTSNLSLYEFQTEGSARLPTCTVASTLQSSYCTVTVGTSRLTLHTDSSPGRLDSHGLGHISDLQTYPICVHRIVDMFCSASTPCVALLQLLHHQLIVLVLRLQSCTSRTGCHATILLAMHSLLLHTSGEGVRLKDA